MRIRSELNKCWREQQKRVESRIPLDVEGREEEEEKDEDEE